VDYGANIAEFSGGKALFMVQGQWAAGSIEKEVQDDTLMLAWPDFPGQAEGMTGSVAAAIQVGYGLTKKGGSDHRVRDAALTFLQEYFYAEEEVTLRLRDGAIVAPILRGYQVPDDLPAIIKRKITFSWESVPTDITDAYLSGAANDALNAGCQKIVLGKATPEQVAQEVEDLWRRDRDRRR
jgi:raffinose/stachyose/melibiose transport system substrate-binding protein